MDNKLYTSSESIDVTKTMRDYEELQTELKIISNEIEDYVMKDYIEPYLEENDDDDLEHLILRAVGLLTGIHNYSFNCLIRRIIYINESGEEFSEGELQEITEEFKQRWYFETDNDFN